MGQRPALAPAIGGIALPVWVSAIFAVCFMAAGIFSLQIGAKRKQSVWRLSGIALLLLCAGCAVYLAAALLLIEGIK